MSVIPPGTPQSSRVAAASAQAPSPHYTTTRRHSLYGAEDRIVIDPGSRIWKVGFSGEGRPREVFSVSDPKTGAPLWPDFSGRSTAERDDALITLENRLQDILRNVYFELLLADPKSRKVILVEHPLIPMAIKDVIVRVLFLNLHVPSISFAPNHLLALIAAGRLSGLVLDSGYLESVSLPIFGSRPLYTCMRSTPLAGSRLNAHLRSLILKYAQYTPPIGVVSSAVPQATTVPEDVITDAVLEDIKTRCCFVGEPIIISSRPSSPSSSTTQGTTTTGDDSISGSGEGSRPGSSASMAMDVDNPRRSLGPQPARPKLAKTPAHLRDLYLEHSRASDLFLRIPGPSTGSTTAIVSRAGLRIPGWVRERAAEILFETGDLDESGCAEIILDSLLKAPMDLRKELASSIVVAGGTAMLPGFISRLHLEILRLLDLDPPEPEGNFGVEQPLPAAPPTEDPDDEEMAEDSPTTPRPGATFLLPDPLLAAKTREPRPRLKRSFDPYEALRPLAPFIAILNHPNPPTASTQSSTAIRNAGKAPGFAPVALPWVGASLTGSLKSGGDEISREEWEEEYEEALVPSPTPSARASPAPSATATPPPAQRASSIAAAATRRLKVDMPGGTAHLLPDWTRPPMRQGAPSVYAT